MKEIPVRVCGDHWVNPQEVKYLITNSNDDIVLDLGSEGASLNALGVVSTVIDLCARINLDPGKILIKNWPNAVEQVPFQRAYLPRISHFWWMSEQYWKDCFPANTQQYNFACFIGRKTLSRCTMLFDIYHEFSNCSLLSLMKDRNPLPWANDTPGVVLEQPHEWVSDDNFYQWWNKCPVTSVDDKAVLDQYTKEQNTNRDLLNYYHLFDIEIVAETYTLGDVFFPTEKTVRPIMSMKPFLIYGPIDYLLRLRDLGFKTFHNIWNEDYDQLQGHQRWKRIKNIMHDIKNLTKDDYQDLIVRCDEVCKHNQTNLKNLIKQYRPQ